MRCQNFVALTALVAVAWTSTGCKFNSSGVRALESDDWLRRGVDRFYLAVAPQGIPMEGTTSGAQVGQEMLFGIGCFGEPKDRSAVVDVPPDACGKGPTKLPLNERTFVHQFPMASDPSKPKKGECVVLMGDDEVLAHMQAFPKDYQTGPGAEAINGAIFSAGSQALSALLLIKPVQQYVSTKAGVAAVAGVSMFGRVFPASGGGVVAQVASARAQTLLSAGTGVGVAIHPKMQMHLMSKGVLAPTPGSVRLAQMAAMRKASAQRTASVLKFVTNFVPGGGGVGSAAVSSVRRFDNWGRTLVGGAGNKVLIGMAVAATGATLWGLVAKGQRNKNRVAFFKGMHDADILANIEINSSPEGEKMRSLIDQGNLREAAAIFNPVLARKFNKDVVGNFEQGWAILGKRPQKFFDTVREIQSELQAYSAQTAAMETPPETGFGASAPADISPEEAKAAVMTPPVGAAGAGGDTQAGPQGGM